MHTEETSNTGGPNTLVAFSVELVSELSELRLPLPRLLSLCSPVLDSYIFTEYVGCGHYGGMESVRCDSGSIVDLFAV